MQPTILALIGKPLAGKDTQADLFVAAHPDSVKISTGHIIRGVVEEGETHRFWPLIGHLKEEMEKGMKLPDEPVLAILGAVMEEQLAEGKKTFVFAGSPRSKDQLDGFDKLAREHNAKIAYVYLDTRDAETYRRSAARNEGRVDDTPEVHKVRLEEYRKHVLPIITELRDTYRLIEINAEQPMEMVAKRIEQEVAIAQMDPEITLPAMARR